MPKDFKLTHYPNSEVHRSALDRINVRQHNRQQQVFLVDMPTATRSFARRVQSEVDQASGGGLAKRQTTESDQADLVRYIGQGHGR